MLQFPPNTFAGQREILAQGMADSYAAIPAARGLLHVDPDFAKELLRKTILNAERFPNDREDLARVLIEHPAGP